MAAEVWQQLVIGYTDKTRAAVEGGMGKLMGWFVDVEADIGKTAEQGVKTIDVEADIGKKAGQWVGGKTMGVLVGVEADMGKKTAGQGLEANTMDGAELLAQRIVDTAELNGQQKAGMGPVSIV